METFTLKFTYTFIGNYAQCRQQYEKSEHIKKGFKFFDWCEACLDQTTQEPAQTPPEEYDDILTEDYLTSLGWAKQKQDDNHYEYRRETSGKFIRDERLLFSVWPDTGVLAAIVHQNRGAYPNGVFSGKIDSRQTFEIILNAVS